MDVIIENAKYKINNYRNTKFYNDIDKIVVDFCNENNVIIEKKDNVYVLYSNDAKDLVVILAKQIHKIDKYVTIKPSVKDKDFTILVNNERLITFFLLLEEEKQTISALNITDKIPDILNMIMDLKEMYSPDTLIKNQDNDEEYINSIEKYIKTFVNDSNMNKKNIQNMILEKLKHKLDKTEIKHIEVLDTPYTILIKERNDIGIIKEMVLSIYEKINKKFNKNIQINKSVIYIQRNKTYIPGDNKLLHFKLYIKHFNKKYNTINQILICNIFNSLQYELMPVYNNKPHKLVVYRISLLIILNMLLYRKKNNFILPPKINEFNKFKGAINEVRQTKDLIQPVMIDIDFFNNS